jgi:caffeoyl-CoA O-methyltransferase
MPIVPEDIEAYAAAHTSSLHPLYARLRDETFAKAKWPTMQVGQLEGRLLKLLAELSGARLAVEIGTFTGYSALSIAEGMPAGSRLITCDVDETTNAIARRYFAEAPWGERIEPRLGPALETLPGIAGPIDLAFIDADKENYVAYWEQLVPKMRAGGLIVADNVLWGGSVLAPSDKSDFAIVAFNERVAADERVEQVMLTVRDGMTVARVRG